MSMTDVEIQKYAESLIVEHATDVEYLSVVECFEDWSWDPYQGSSEISEDDARKVHDLIHTARVTVTFRKDTR